MANFVMVEGSAIVKGFGFVEGNLAVILHEEFSPKTPMLFVYDISTSDSLALFIEMTNAKSKGGFFNANIRSLPVLTRKPVVLH